MFRRIAILLAITTVLLLAVIALNLTSLSTARAQSVQQWEYLDLVIVTNPVIYAISSGNQASADDLNAAVKQLSKPTNPAVFKIIGDDGWELVTAIVLNNGGIEDFTFKRPVQS